MKKLLIILLALVMCLSVFVSCDKNKDDNKDNNDNKNANVEKDTEAVADAIGKLNLKDLVNSTLDEIFAQGTQSELNELLAELKKLNGELNVTATVDGEKRSVYFGMKDEIVKITDPFGETGYAFLAGNSFVLLSPETNGYGLEVSDEMPVMMPDISESVDLEQYKQMVDMYLTDDVMKALEGFKLDVTKADLVEKDGFYVLTNDALVRIANEVLDTAIDVMKALEAPAEALPPVDETKTQIKAAIEALNLQIGFSVKNDKVVGIKFATEFDPDAVSAIFGGGAKDEAMPAAETSSKVAISLVALSNDDATLPASVEFAYSFEEDGDKQAFSNKATFIYNDKNALCGADVSFNMEMGNTSLGWYDEDDKSGSYNIRGTQKISGTVKLDLSKISTTGATVADINVTMSAKADKYINEYYNETTGEWVEEIIKDTATINKIEGAKCYAKSGSVTANAKVEKTGVLAFNFNVKEDSATTTAVSGTFAWTAAPNYGTVDNDVRTKIIENEAFTSSVNAIMDRVDAYSEDLFMTDFINITYTFKDTASNLWISFDRYDTVCVHFTQPEGATVLQ